MRLKITNPKNGLIKIINAQNYKMFEVLQTFKIYMKAGFTVHVIDGLKWELFVEDNKKAFEILEEMRWSLKNMHQMFLL